jgi:hypothetical protein
VKEWYNMNKNNDFRESWNVGDSMSENDYKRILEKMKAFTAAIPSTSPETSKEFLIRAGILDKSGKISKVYQK